MCISFSKCFFGGSQSLVTTHSVEYSHFVDHRHACSKYAPVYYFHQIIFGNLHRLALDNEAVYLFRNVFLFGGSQSLVTTHPVEYSHFVDHRHACSKYTPAYYFHLIIFGNLHRLAFDNECVYLFRNVFSGAHNL